ncbi:hypothetical protein B2J96_05950 [Mycobacterium shigaense]|nr:hypothetical protein B2J96_05950 [Mycobacterium shigaense]
MALMSEPVQGGDETAAQDVDETAAVPNSTPTESVGLAWSSNDEGADETRSSEPGAIRRSWSSTWGRAGALVTGGVVLAGAIVLTSWLLTAPDQSGGSQTTSKSAAQPPTARPKPNRGAPTTGSSAPPSIASTPDQDNKYVQALNDRGISFANPEAAIYNGKMVCQDIGRGVTVQQEADAFRASNPALSDSANAYVGISVRAYCPENNALVAGF